MTKKLSNQQKGSLLAFVAVILITPDSLFIRLSHIDTWGLLFYRGAIPFLFVLLGLLLFYKMTFFKLLFSMGSPGGRRLVNIEQEADSVLSQRGPVVHPIRSGATRSESSSRERRAPTGSVNRSYYSRRFR